MWHSDSLKLKNTAYFENNLHLHVVNNSMYKYNILWRTLINNNNNNNLLLIRRKLTSEYDQMCLTTKITPNNYNKIKLRILEINNFKSSQSNNNRQKPS